MVIDNVVSSVKNVVKKASVGVVAGYSALVMGLGACGDTNNNYYGDGDNGDSVTKRCEDAAEDFISSCCNLSP
ncbi:MAG: hypothetical protein KJ771_03190, partial [Nanoarchaeota archaeon]|nr:hypothetical protein [Nanoarchaeota archaeon]